MMLKFDPSKFIVPALGAACVGGAIMVGSGLREPAVVEPHDPADVSEARVPNELTLDGYVPTMDEVVAKHLFVPEREATGENAFPDLLVKGVYVGETQRNAVFSLKSKPAANLRVWQGDEDAAMAQVEDDRDLRKPIVDFLGEWRIQSIDFAGVTVEHVITGEVETYAVEYKPLKHAKASSANGYGQGYVVDASTGGAKATAQARAPSNTQPTQGRPPSGSSQVVAGRVGQYMQRLSPQQRQQFMQQLQKQNAAAAKKSGGSSQGNSSKGNSSKGKSSSSNKKPGSSGKR